MSLLLRWLGDAEFFLVCLWHHLQPPTSRMQSQCSATSVEVPITLPETVSSRGANHGTLPEIRCYQCQQQGHVASRCPGKLGKEREAGTPLSPHKLEEVLSVMKVKVNGMDRIALVDSGCSLSVVSGMLCRSEVWRSTAILTAGKKYLSSHGVGSITLTVTNRNPLKTNVLVVNSKPLGFNLLLGMDVIKKLGGVHIDEGGKVHFAEAAHTLGATIELEQPDFRAEFDQRTKSWAVSWKWSGDQPPEKLYKRVPEYTIPERARAEYDKELQNWIDNGWLVPYPEDKLGPPKGLIPLIAVIQQNKQKVRPPLDYRELNDHVGPFTARADICTEKLREWWRAGSC